MEVVAQWQQRIIYPRWAALAHYGYGEARFIFYPPASWLLGAALGAVLPWKLVPGAYVWLALMLSGCSMFLLARRWMNRRLAIFAAALYAVNPYYVVILYWRSAYAELLAGALLPLLLLHMMELEDRRGKALVPLALVVAGAALTNAPASLMVNYSLVLLALALAVVRRSARILWYAAAAGLLGAALAAFYIVPAAYEEKWVNIAQLLSPGVRPADNFLFTMIDDPDHNQFNRLISLIATAELILLATAIWLSRRRRTDLWWVLVIWTVTSAFLMFSFSAPLWAHLPLLRFVQLPWRWLLCLNLALVVLITMPWRRRMRAAAVLGMLAVLLIAWHRILPPWWDNAADIADILSQHRDGSGYEGTDEYASACADPYNVRRDAPAVASDGGGVLRVRVQQWNPEVRSFIAEASQPGKLALRLFNYPAWRVEINGHSVKAITHADTGQMVIPVEAGESRVRVTFMRTWDRTAGALVSLVSTAGLLLWLVTRRLADQRLHLAFIARCLRPKL